MRGLLLGPRPGIAQARAGAEAACFGQGDSVAEAAGENVWVMGVTPERDRLSAFLFPPANDLWAEPSSRSLLKKAAGPWVFAGVTFDGLR